MRNLTDYIMDVKPRYEFVIRVADCDLNEDERGRINAGLSMYVVENMGSTRRLPVKNHADFHKLGPCAVHVIEVQVRYPTITDQLRQIVAERLGVSAANVVVRTKHEDQIHEAQPIEPEKTKGSFLLKAELESDSAQELAGQRRVDSMLKELETRKYQIAGVQTKTK